MIQVDKARQILNTHFSPLIEGMGYEYIGCERSSQGKRVLLRLYIDHANRGITIEDCTRVSKQIRAVLNVEPWAPSDYLLEVSSPGVDRLLFTKKHFLACVGQVITVHLHEPLQGSRKFCGALQTVQDDTLSLIKNDEKIIIPWHLICRARLKDAYNACTKEK